MPKLLTKPEAAKVMGASTRTVYRAINRGHLRLVRQGGQVGVLKDDVLRLQQARSPAPDQLLEPLNRATFGRLLARLRTLEINFSVALKLLGVNLDPLGLSRADLVRLYRTAETHGTKGWPRGVEYSWADVFVRLRHDDLVQLADELDLAHPYAPFYKLCATMRLATRDQELRDQLDNGRENLFSLAVLWEQLHGGTAKAAELAVKRAGASRKVAARQIDRDRMRHPGRVVGAAAVPEDPEDIMTRGTR